MKQTFRFSFYLILLTLSNCIGAGTHGSLERYQFPIPKDSLQSVINEVIHSTPNIYRDTTESDVYMDNYYRDRINYETIYIETEADLVKIIFRYYGDETDWKKSSNSEIFICYAYDKSGRGGSEGMENISDTTQTRLVEVFNEEFIKEVNKVALQK